MHSIAHLLNPEQKLRELKEMLNPGAEVYVITPNCEWLLLRDNQKPGYKPDPTVIRHFYLTDLCYMFEGAGYEVNIYGQFGACHDSDRSQYINERLFLKATIS